MLSVAILAVAVVIVVELIFYAFLLPDKFQRPLRPYAWEQYGGRIAYAVSYLLSLLRAPLGLVPYLVKLFIFFGLRVRYESAQSTYVREALNMLGDVVNLALTTALVFVLAGPPSWQSPRWIFYLPLAAELVRVLAERIPISFSVLWQLLPHRAMARALQARQSQSWFWQGLARVFARYCRYYVLYDVARTRYLLCALKRRADQDSEVAQRLDYVQTLRIIPLRQGLRSGSVRDVARAEVFIHRTWTNDPWLLVGTALRRAPWMFDPRYVRRPFYYMTEANLLATLFVLEHARYSPPYAVFQFGHEIRVARLHLFYWLLRKFGLDVEHQVQADGTFQFDQFIFWLERRWSRTPASPAQPALYADEETVAAVLRREQAGEHLAAADIALSYTYPLKYIEEALLDKIAAARIRQMERSLPG